MGVAANGPHPLSDIAPSAPLLTFLEITPGPAHKTKLFNSKMKCKNSNQSKQPKKYKHPAEFRFEFEFDPLL